MGIRKKISIGFISVGMVLLLSGAISVGEMSRLRSGAEQIVEASTRNAELSKRMLNALQLQNSAVLEMVFTSRAVDDRYYTGIYDFNVALLDATETIGDRAELDDIYNANERYHNIIDNHSAETADSESSKWFLDSYVEAYYALDLAVKNYMTSPHSSLSMRLKSLETNVYKTITPSIMTMIVSILIVLMFYFFVDIYYVKPILKINRSLGLHLHQRVPYEVKIEEQNEISELNDNIHQLIDDRRQTKNNS
ncbi:MAG: hypothetical protein SOZ00_06630 [Tidjanibacter sp.]|nr:hypothetical protein [Tidjanibacter sp.]